MREDSLQHPLDDYGPVAHFFMKKSVVVWTIYITSVITGLGQAFVFIAQGNYISLCATE